MIFKLSILAAKYALLEGLIKLNFSYISIAFSLFPCFSKTSAMASVRTFALLLETSEDV